MDGFNRVLTRIAEVMGKYGSYLLLVIMIIVMTNILLRATVGIAISGSLELLGLIFALFISVAITFATVKGRQIIVTLIITNLSPRTQKVLSVITNLLTAGTWAALAYAGGTFAIHQFFIGGETSEMLEIQVPPFRLFWAAICAFLCVLFLRNTVNILRGEKVP
ncbi:TRAP transporter small permease subunit [Chloroflexota bacterium]